MEIIIWLSLFILSLLIIEEGYFIARAVWKPELRKIHKRLRTLSYAQYTAETIDIEKRRILSQVSWLNRFLLKFRGLERVEHILEQADTNYPLGFFILLSLVLFAVGYLFVSFFTSNVTLILSVAISLFLVPPLYIHMKRKKRMQKFQSRLPDALELIARALRAGHAFTGSLKMVVEDFDDPIGTEFEKTLNQINFGVDVPEALKQLANRVDCDDLNFFVVSVIVQRETGGNLAEIIENLSHLIRERFKLHGRVRVLSSEGKLSAIVLIAIPFLVVAALAVMNPKYIRVLIEDPIGKILIFCSLSMMAVGAYVMKKMIAIKV
jgi:tight adherence protein B